MNTGNIKASKIAGITLIEMLVTVVLLAIIASIAIPAFNQLLQNHRSNSQAMLFFNSVQYARTEAIRQNTQIRLSANEGGWCVHTGETCTSASALREYANASQLLGASLVNMIFDGRGRRSVPVTNAVVVRFQPASCQGTSAHLVTVNPLGNPTVNKGSCQ